MPRDGCQNVPAKFCLSLLLCFRGSQLVSVETEYEMNIISCHPEHQQKLELSCKGLGAAKNLRSSSNYFHLSSGINKIHEPAFWHLEGAFQLYE